MLDFILKWFTIMADSDGVGLNREQFTTRMSICTPSRPPVRSVSPTLHMKSDCLSALKKDLSLSLTSCKGFTTLGVRGNSAHLPWFQVARCKDLFDAGEHDHLCLIPSCLHGDSWGHSVHRCSNTKPEGFSSRPCTTLCVKTGK